MQPGEDLILVRNFLLFFSAIISCIISKQNISFFNAISCLFSFTNYCPVKSVILIASQPTKSARLLFTYSTHNVQVHNKLDIKIPTVHV